MNYKLMWKMLRKDYGHRIANSRDGVLKDTISELMDNIEKRPECKPSDGLCDKSPD